MCAEPSRRLENVSQYFASRRVFIDKHSSSILTALIFPQTLVKRRQSRFHNFLFSFPPRFLLFFFDNRQTNPRKNASIRMKWNSIMKTSFHSSFQFRSAHYHNHDVGSRERSDEWGAKANGKVIKMRSAGAFSTSSYTPNSDWRLLEDEM